MLRSAVRIARVSFARATPARPMARRVAGMSLLSAAAITSASASAVASPSSVGSNSRERPTLPSATPTAAVKKQHWSADQDGISATQRALSKITSSDAAERLVSAATRELLHFARETPGVVAKLSSVRVAVTNTVPHDEQAFLAQMEQEYGYDVLPILRREEWEIAITPPPTATNTAPLPTLNTFVCYYQEGTQKILWRKLAVSKI